MYCPNCDQTFLDTQRFCGICGTKLQTIPESATIERFKQALDNRQYAMVSDQIPDHSSFGLLEIRAEARKKFDESLNRMVEIYLANHGPRPPKEDDIGSLLLDFDDETGHIYDSYEAVAYAQALLDEASQAIQRQDDPDTIRAAIYTSQILPGGSTARQNRIAAMLAQLNSVPAPSVEITVLVQQNGDVPVAVPSSQMNQLLLEETSLPQSVEDATEPTLLPEESDSAEQSLGMAEQLLGDVLNRLQNIDDQAPIQTITDLIAEAKMQLHPLLEKAVQKGNESNADRISRAHERLKTLEKLPELQQIMQRPLVDWLDPQNDFVQQSGQILDVIEDKFIDVSPEFTGTLRDQHKRKLLEFNQIQIQINGLGKLDGQALREELDKLEKVLPRDFPALADANNRYAVYVANQEAREKEMQAQENARKLAEAHRILLVEFDELLKAPILNQSKLDARFSEIRATQDAADPSTIIDPQTLAYYALLYSDIQNRLKRTDKTETAQTSFNKREYFNAIKVQRESLDDALNGGESVEIEKEQKALNELRNALKTQLNSELAVRLNDIKKRLDEYDYLTVPEELAAQRKDFNDTETQIDEEFEKRINEYEQRAKDFAEKASQVEKLLDEVAQLAPLVLQEHQKADFVSAFTKLTSALKIAPWLDIRVQQAINDLQNRRSQFVDGLIQLATTNCYREDYQESSSLLDEAARVAYTNDQNNQIKAVRNLIADRQRNQAEAEKLRKDLRILQEKARKGEEIEIVEAEAAGYHARIGDSKNQKIDSASWAEFNGYLVRTEHYVRKWIEYRQILGQSEQAAIAGDDQQVNTFIGKLNGLADSTFLPVKSDVEGLKITVNQSSKADRVRTQIRALRRDINDNPDTVTLERIGQVIDNAKSQKEADIVDELPFLENIYQKYLARWKLAAYMKAKLFKEFNDYYDTLDQRIQDDPGIAKLRVDASQTETQQKIEQELQNMLRSIRPAFTDAWLDPKAFKNAVNELVKYADSLTTDQRQPQQRLHSATLDLLVSIADKLIRLKTFDEQQSRDAQPIVRGLLDQIPSGYIIDQDKLLHVYQDDLAHLRSELLEKQEILNKWITADNDNIRALEFSKSAYTDVTTNKPYNNTELSRVRADFVKFGNRPSISTKHIGEAGQYISTLTDIIKLLKNVDAIEPLILAEVPTELSASKQTTSEAETQVQIQVGKQRLQEFNAGMEKISDSSQAILSSELGTTWPGIEGDPKYAMLAKQQQRICALAEAQIWNLRTTNFENLNKANLLQLRTDYKRLSALEMGANEEAELENANLKSLVNATKQARISTEHRFKQINKRLDELNQQDKARRTQVMVLVGIVMLAILAYIAWGYSPVREAVISRTVGTLTPTLLPSPMPGPIVVIGDTTTPATPTVQVIVITATPTPTPSPTPTPTPVPPQAGVVIVPGSANVRNSPSADARSVGTVTAGDEVLVTAYATAPDGAIWYRLEVGTLKNVWLRSRLTVQNREYDSVRFEGGVSLNPYLKVSYTP